MQKILFIDQDGTLICEPKPDYQLDQWNKLCFLPGALSWLPKIVKELDYKLVLVTNQDGLGTEVFPEEPFVSIHQHILQTFKNEGVEFDEVCIDRSFPHENLPTRKPGTAMLNGYLNNPDYDLANSFVLGDRITDIQLANNLGGKGIFLNTPGGYLMNEEDWKKLDEASPALTATSWKEIYEFLKLPSRKSEITRNTNETKISIKLNLDGSGKGHIDTGIRFFDHMLDQLCRHGKIDLDIKVDGDLDIDEHHTIEDTALALGTAFDQAIGNKLGMERYGYCLPMDDCLAQVSLDFGGRPWLVWKAEFKREKIGEMPTEMFLHFFKSFSDNARCNLNIQATGDNEHHKIEGIFKAWAKAIKMAVRRDPEHLVLPSTKGVL
ncbi:MAG: bifunctional histidinol-phosphatase/imidazoleglycerol-phosphate dehydratase HisB [Bacteroidota bacterium]